MFFGYGASDPYINESKLKDLTNLFERNAMKNFELRKYGCLQHDACSNVVCIYFHFII